MGVLSDVGEGQLAGGAIAALQIPRRLLHLGHRNLLTGLSTPRQIQILPKDPRAFFPLLPAGGRGWGGLQHGLDHLQDLCVLRHRAHRSKFEDPRLRRHEHHRARAGGPGEEGADAVVRGGVGDPPLTPPRPPRRRRAGRSSPPQPDWAAGGDGTMADKSTAMVTMQVDSAIDSTSVTVEEGRREGMVPASAPGTPVVLPDDKNRGSFLYYLRKGVRGNPPTFSRFFLRRHSTSAPAGGEEAAGGARREHEQVKHTKVAGEKGVEGNPSPHGENKGILIGAASKRRKRRKGSCRGAGAPRPRGKNKGDWDEQKKKVVVVSPYFTAASSDQRATKRGADDVEIIVQRRTKTKKNRTNQAAEPTAEVRTAGGGNDGSPEVADRKKKNKRKRKHQSVQLSAAERMADAYKRVPDDNPWVPPFSHHELLQEFHFFDHWRVLIICMLLNRTTGREVQKVLPRLFLLCPDAQTTTKVSEEDIEEITKHLGFQRKRSKMIKRMSKEYLQPEWTHVTQLHGIGKYAADAYAIFCSGMWKDVKPNDHKLVDYWRFLLNDKDARESMTVQKSTCLDQSQWVS